MIVIRTLEELSMNAWPALQTQLYDGWVLRFANGYTRRANSINPIYPSVISSEARNLNTSERDFPSQKTLLETLAPHASAGVTDEKISVCEEMYRAKNLPVVFKMTDAVFPENLDEILERRGYAAEARTSVQVCDLGSVAPPTNRDALMSESLTQIASRRKTQSEIQPGSSDFYDGPRWVDDYCRLNGVVAQHKATMMQMLANVAPVRCFVALKEKGQTIAVGLGVAENGFLGLFDLVTEEKYRGRGFGTQLILNLFEWGKQHDARRAYLQVMLSNTGAIRLYERLGFREAYQYWYRVKK